MSNLIKLNAGVAAIVADDAWQIVHLPAAEAEVKKQAGKVVLFKLTGAESATAEQIAATEVPAGKVVLPLSVWLARKAEFAARVAAGEVGVWLETHELVETLAADQPDLNVFPLIAVFIERFADGRAYSMAALLRTRYGFKGELRALGDVLRDQLFFMKRCGFDAYQIRADRSAQDALASLNDFSEPYQAAVVVDQPVWRRHARS
ncbi:MAG: hypothetical protein CGU28_04375 [Candidatus Dactylopiibacterium carminicum]|uniref:DUF934 domain-containing protein n=1 Tax=Candidatus Dactylopiibacterium carminicum TaxID=857335 RepID=A0A272EWT8_9RHOO|nr:DUF934 domain-containing protein [Candidatus Dactylopiibacterium carminicum]KAF7600049.1 DUF934 domain-containing protein [Candidatus Dactylopiibacterium carminicum]PAS94561.1 MAG: hypothetical protein CGU29_03265 [Candidatus Dactylopiibacterium carminicum]PAS97600.1 MAG: hypothetical protein CGU28_04375 [Candidatus Dactylopiibacterium carminicum]PAT00053.1 MAG: hypothetical protein BSR46_04755 [Candidatus Dactylopiibacterium carminicum]